MARFHALGLKASVAEQDVCCHATQDKVFVTAPDVPLGWWEYYVVTDDNPADSIVMVRPWLRSVPPPETPRPETSD